MAAAEGEADTMSRESSAGTDDSGETSLVWSKLPKDVQLQVLSYLPIPTLCQLRSVCKEWRNVIHRRDFRSMYDAMNTFQDPTPAICYMESSYPTRLVWSAYDFAAKTWKEMSSFPSLPVSLPLTRSFYSVGGLLCLYLWRQDRHCRFPNHGVSSWLVWHPFRNKRKLLPPCKHLINPNKHFFVHAFVSDEHAKRYKILMAHVPKFHRELYNDGTPDKLVTEIYDSATGVWTDACEHTLTNSELGNYMYQLGHPNRRGVLYNGVVYFLAGDSSFAPNVLLCYDIKGDEWREEVHMRIRSAIFEWDAQLMTIMCGANPEGEGVESFFVAAWDSALRTWQDTGIEIPLKIRGKFESVAGLTIVGAGNHLLVTGYTKDWSWKVAVYRRAENFWRVPPSGAFSNRLAQARVEGLVLHKPGLDWRP